MNNATTTVSVAGKYSFPVSQDSLKWSIHIDKYKFRNPTTAAGLSVKVRFTTDNSLGLNEYIPVGIEDVDDCEITEIGCTYSVKEILLLGFLMRISVPKYAEIDGAPAPFHWSIPGLATSDISCCIQMDISMDVPVFKDYAFIDPDLQFILRTDKDVNKGNTKETGPPVLSLNPEDTSDATSSDEGGVSGGAIAAIVIILLFVIGGVIGVVVWDRWRRQSKRADERGGVE